MRSCYPSRPPCPPQGYLVQKIMAYEKRSIPCLCAEWNLPCCSDHCIQSVSACGAAVWSLESNSQLHVSIPVHVRLCNSCGHCLTHTAEAHADLPLPQHMVHETADSRNTLLVLSCVRLVHAECTCAGVFRVKLAVALEIFLLRYETICQGAPKPQCPQLPLYPPPMC